MKLTLSKVIRTKVRAKCAQYGLVAEHIGFVSYAACETVGAPHSLTYYSAAYLLITGLIVMFTHDVSAFTSNGS